MSWVCSLPLILRHQEPVTSVAFSPDGKRLASGSLDTTIEVWDVESGEDLTTLRGHEGGGRTMFGPDGKRIIFIDGNNIKVWDATTGEEPMMLSGHDGSIWSISHSPDGRRILSSGEDKTIRIWDAATGTELMILRGHEDIVSWVAFSSYGQRIVSSGWDGSIKIWDALNGNELMMFHRNQGKIRAETDG